MGSVLQKLFRRALKVSVVAPLALTACAPDTSSYVAAQCGGNGALSIGGLQPPVIPDVTVLRNISSLGASQPETVSDVSVSGTACATATDVPACTDALASLVPASGFAERCQQICSRYVLATTRGDTVEAVSSIAALRTFLGDIDTAQEALLIAFANGYDVDCTDKSMGAAKQTDGGWAVLARQGFACGEGTAITRHYLTIATDGRLTDTGNDVVQRGSKDCAIGRRPPGLAAHVARACDDALGAWLSDVAQLEASAVPAFERLRLELAALGAPRALQQGAVTSALEELDHARKTAALARHFGGAPVMPEVHPTPLRSLQALALDNATEGCVRETFGALVAQYQAQHAADPRVRELMRGIADDETRHAELSWALDAWAQRGLCSEQRAALGRARREAAAKLKSELQAPVEEALVTQAGLPSPQEATRLFDAVAALWA